MRRLWAVCYDIVDDGRRRRVANALEDHGERVQESVFECYLDAAALAGLRGRLAELIDAKEDTVRWYPLCSWCTKRVVWSGSVGGTDDPPYFIV
jgi:CRISPR-associated protein Cas2